MLYDPDDPWFIAMHEAGHAVCAMVLNIPFKGVDVIRRPQDDGRTSAGKVHLEELDPQDVIGKGEAILQRLIQSYAGPCAEELVNQQAFSQKAADSDRKHILQIARFAVAGRMENHKPQPISKEEMVASEPKIRALIQKAEEAGRQFAKQNEKAIRMVATALQARSSLSFDEVRAILDECQSAGD